MQKWRLVEDTKITRKELRKIQYAMFLDQRTYACDGINEIYLGHSLFLYSDRSIERILVRAVTLAARDQRQCC